MYPNNNYGYAPQPNYGQQPVYGQQPGVPPPGAPYGQPNPPPGPYAPQQQGFRPPPPAGGGAGGPNARFNNAWYSNFFNSMAPHEMQEAQAWFAAIDQDRSGKISAAEISRCTFAGKPLGWDVSVKLVRVFDKDNSGEIDFFEYAAMHKFLSLMQHAFFSGDKDRSGRLDAQEIHVALGVAQLTVPFNVVQVLFNKYNRDGYGLDFSSFLMLGSHIAVSKSIFHWENSAQGNRGVITIDLNKFIELTGRL